MKILITGGAGFIGSNFLRYILRQHPSYKIINLDKLTYAGNLDNLVDIKNNPNYKFYKGDICNQQIVDRLVRECKIIVNMAAETHVDRSITDAADFIKTNYFGTYQLLEAAKRYKTSLYFQISTDEVYGSVEKGFSAEKDSLMPNSPYAASKASADLLCQAYAVTYKIPIVIARPCNNFGFYQFPEKVIPLFVTNLLEEKNIPVYGDGLNIRDWLFVEDNCRALDLILHKGKIGQIYNIGAGNCLNNLELTKLILRKMGKTKKYIKFVKDRPGHDRRYALSYEKIKKLGWRPKYDFDEALQITIDWYRNNPEWWKKLKKES